jgi:hypothetical protein
MESFQNRIIRAATLDVNIYEEVEADKSATVQAIAVVIFASIAAGIGSIGSVGLSGIFIGTITALIAWLVWAYITYIIGVKLLPEPQTESDYGELLRTIGFSSAPGMIRIIGIIPGLSGIIFFLTGIWMLVAMIVAVRQALDYQSTLRAVVVCIAGWIIQGIILALFLAIFG